MRLHGTKPVIKLVLFGVTKSWKYVDFCGEGEKRASGFFAAFAFARCRGGCAKLERKDDRKRTGEGRPLGRIGVKGLCDFRRGLEKPCPKSQQFNTSLSLIFLLWINLHF